MVRKAVQNPLEIFLDNLRAICVNVSGLMAARDLGPAALAMLEDNRRAHKLFNRTMAKFQNAVIANPPPATRDAAMICNWIADLLRATADIIPEPIG